MRNHKKATLREQQSYINEFLEKVDRMVEDEVINEYQRILVFLCKLSNKIGNKICKDQEIKIDSPESTRRK